jgi:NADH:ubiquinone oxidoreductase subunit 6 (subunit J)
MLTIRRFILVAWLACGIASVAAAAHLPGASAGTPSDLLPGGAAAAPSAAASGGAPTLEAVVFYLFAAVAVVSAVGIVLTRNIVRAAIWLLGTLGGVAGLYFLMAANFLGAIQLIVYVGGTLVLIIFGVMLTSRSPGARLPLRRWEIISGAAVCGLLFAALSFVLVRANWTAYATPSAELYTVARIGNELLTDYLVPFEVASVLLLVVMIGAAYLARPEKKC